jgi:dipeptidyl aminopeptidase/acylaminoacyl peptidase
MTKRAPYGSWVSALSAGQIVAESVRLAEARLAGDRTWWIEGRPHEGGRSALVCATRESVFDVLPEGYSVRSRVHEYGGGAYAVRGTQVCFVNDSDQCVCLLEPGGPRRLHAAGSRRHADLAFDPCRPRIYCVCEDHGAPGEPVTSLVAVDLEGGRVQTLAEGADFYSSPRPSPDGRQLAWISWRHPYMPWDATELWVAALGDDGRPGSPRLVAGRGAESIQQPSWHGNALYFLSDRDGWWNLYRWDGAQTLQITRERAELGGAPWVFAASTYALTGDEFLCVPARDGRRSLVRTRLDGRAVNALAAPYTEVESLRADGGRAVFIGATPSRGRAVVELDLATGTFRDLRSPAGRLLEDDDISAAQAFAFDTGAGETAHAWYYAPRNREYGPAAGERPPVIVKCHGGPTSCASAALDLRVQYWTQRGFAILDVDYRGSTGYGRAYRERLYGGWGVIEVEDCLRAVEHAAGAGLVDGERAVISGSSSGGFTVLCALVAGTRFRAGASHYGIGDLELLISDTHKFESRYTQRLTADDPAVWRARSPIHHVDGIDAPVLFTQGLEDRVVPPGQSQTMVRALRARGVPVAYLEFPGEAHGFRRAATLRRALEAELAFFGLVLGVQPADELEALAIEPPLP